MLYWVTDEKVTIRDVFRVCLLRQTSKYYSNSPMGGIHTTLIKLRRLKKADVDTN